MVHGGMIRSSPITGAARKASGPLARSLFGVSGMGGRSRSAAAAAGNMQIYGSERFFFKRAHDPATTPPRVAVAAEQGRPV
jgi:hypothetical protein